jgi:hypothetical protein
MQSGSSLLITLLKFVVAFILAFFGIDVTCALFSALHLTIFNWVCGHNQYIQFPILYVLIYLFLGLVPPFSKKK